MIAHPFAGGAATAAQARLLLFTALLLGATVTIESERSGSPEPEGWSSVFVEPPAYLHPAEAIRFDISGLPAPAADSIEAALLDSLQPGDLQARAHAHMTLAVYYKLRGKTSLAAEEKRKGDYWLRVAKVVP